VSFADRSQAKVFRADLTREVEKSLEKELCAALTTTFADVASHLIAQLNATFAPPVAPPPFSDAPPESWSNDGNQLLSLLDFIFARLLSPQQLNAAVAAMNTSGGVASWAWAANASIVLPVSDALVRATVSTVRVEWSNVTWCESDAFLPVSNFTLQFASGLCEVGLSFFFCCEQVLSQLSPLRRSARGAR
jgi:hypothetical protein